jgi:uncharacterized repeat protein (TIGR01451 family)
MVKDDKRGHRAWWRTLPGAAGLALIMTAALLWASGVANPWVPIAHAQTATPTATATPTVTPTPNPNCDLDVTKKDSPTTVGEGGEITYTITIENNGSGSGDCSDLTVTDTIPTDTDCVDATVTDDAGLDFDIEGCDSSGDVVWDTNDDLETDDQVVVEMVVELTSGASEDDTISNEACADSTDDVAGDCDTETTKVGEPATKTPTPAPTATVRPVAPPPPPPPVAPPPPPPAPPPTTLIAPLTGSGTESGVGGSLPLALALGLAGGCLLLLGGAAMLRRPR